MSAQCPGRHRLKIFIIPHTSFYCDGCRKRMRPFHEMWGCRICNYDLCRNCYSTKNKPKVSESDTKYYEILGLDKSASQQEIKKVYHKLARQLHPDKHPEEPKKYHTKFQELQEAYEVLGDPETRQLYDQYLNELCDNGQNDNDLDINNLDIHDLYEFMMHEVYTETIFGFMSERERGRRRKNVPRIEQNIDVTLEDLYIGSSKLIEYKKMTVCIDCGGKGGRKIKCSDCHGVGWKAVVEVTTGYRMKSHCLRCNGKGTLIPKNEKCRKCKGNGLYKIHKKLDFRIPRGSKHAEKIILSGQGHEIPDAANGDLLIILRCVKHDIYERDGADLGMTQKITLKQALCGFPITIPHISGHDIKFKSRGNEIIQHGSGIKFRSEGMPQKGSNNMYGDLYVKFEIVYPQTLDEKIKQKIGELLPMGPDEIAQSGNDEKEELERNMTIEEKQKSNLSVMDDSTLADRSSQDEHDEDNDADDEQIDEDDIDEQ